MSSTFRQAPGDTCALEVIGFSDDGRSVDFRAIGEESEVSILTLDRYELAALQALLSEYLMELRK